MWHPARMTNGKVSSVSASGISEAEAQSRLKSEGYNELPRQDRRTPLRIVLDVLREPMLALLLGGGFIYLLLGDLKEALILLAFALMSVVITVVQETRTERVLEALRDLTSPRALVIRDGVRKRIAGRDVARGDLVVLAEGDRVPADAVLVEAHDLQADKSLLTGESVPVRKVAATDIPEGHARPGGDDLPFVYSGALVVRGSGLAHVVATGPRSEIGKIGQSLHALETEPPRLQVQTARLVRLAALGERPSASWRSYFTARCGVDGLMRSSPASPLVCRCCRKSFQSCSPCLWRWGRGEFRRHACSLGGPLPSKRSAQRRYCAPTRPAL